MPSYQRKYIDLIRQVSAKWANWDPPIPIQVGAYGVIDPDTGELLVEGNVYDPRVQDELDKLDTGLRMIDHPPLDGSTEDEVVISTKGAKRVNLSLAPEVDLSGIANASIKGQWQFERGKRDALLIMHSPRMRFLPPGVILGDLYKVPALHDKWLVTSVHVCPAFSMYLSNKSGEKVSFALVAQVPVAAAPGVSAGADASAGWWSDTQADMLRKACDKSGNYAYTPLYTMKRRIGWFNRLFRDDEEEKEGDDLWVDVTPPWEPLDEDGDVDTVDVEAPEPLDDD